MEETVAGGSGEGELISVAAAVALSGIAPRTLYRYAKLGQVRSRKDGRTLFLDANDVRRKAQERQPSALARSASAPAGNGKLAVSDGDLASRVFELFEQGVTPQQVVRGQRIAPEMVLSLYRAYSALKGLEDTGKPTLESQLRAFAARFDKENQNTSALIAEFEKRLSQTERQIQKLARHVAELPVPPRSEFKCPDCGKVGFLRVVIVCGSCGSDSSWGFRP